MAPASRRRFLASAAALAGGFILSPARAATELDEVLRRHAAARGSMRDIRTMTASLNRTEAEAMAKCHYAAMRSPARRMRYDMSVAYAHYSTGLDAKGPWETFPFHTKRERSSNGPQLKRELLLNLCGLEDLPALGVALRYRGRAKPDGNGLHIVEARFADKGLAIFIDPQNWLIAKRCDARLLEGASVTFPPTETAFGDYRPVQGVQTPFKTWETDLSNSRRLRTDTVTALAYNTPLTEAMLSRDAPPL